MELHLVEQEKARAKLEARQARGTLRKHGSWEDWDDDDLDYILDQVSDLYDSLDYPEWQVGLAAVNLIIGARTGLWELRHREEPCMTTDTAKAVLWYIAKLASLLVEKAESHSPETAEAARAVCDAAPGPDHGAKRGERSNQWNVGKGRLLFDLAGQLETGVLRVANDLPLGKAFRDELLAFKVDMSAAGNLTIDVRGSDHHGDLVVAAALALFSANQHAGSYGEGRIVNYY